MASSVGVFTTGLSTIGIFSLDPVSEADQLDVRESVEALLEELKHGLLVIHGDHANRGGPHRPPGR